MSPQLAISSAFSVFAMAALCLIGVSGVDRAPLGSTLFAAQAEMPSLTKLGTDLLP